MIIHKIIQKNRRHAAEFGGVDDYKITQKNFIEEIF